MATEFEKEKNNVSKNALCTLKNIFPPITPNKTLTPPLKPKQK
jgi:hypothetical protein